MPPLLLRSSSPPSAAGVVCRRRRKRAKRSVSARASWQELAGVLVFSAVPFTAVKALAGSPLGALLRRRLEARKASAAAEADALRAAARQARGSSFWYGGARPRWLGPIPYDYPEHLAGEFPGDYGFDIAGLGRDPVAFANYFKFPEHKWSSRMEEYIENALVAQWLGLAVATHPSQVRSLLGTISWTSHRLLSSLYCEAVRRSGVTRCKQGVKSKMKASTCRGGRGGKGREETQKR